jgi:transcriptional regulator with XRE-family HTH domain
MYLEIPPMSRAKDTLDVQAQLGRRLRELRKAAGMSQAELALRMGRAGRKFQPYICQLEKGRIPYPSVNLVADYLRACGRSFADVATVLDDYTTQPPVPEKRGDLAVREVVAALPVPIQREVLYQDIDESVARRFEGKPPEPPADRVLRARRRIALVTQRLKVDRTINRGLTLANLGTPPSHTVVAHLTNYGHAVFRILKRTRKSKPERRAALLAQAPARLRGVVPDKAIEFIQSAILDLFRNMEMTGELDKLPEAGPTRAEARDQFRRAEEAHTEARRRLVEQLTNEVRPMLQAAGVPKNRHDQYARTVRHYCHISDCFDPGTPEQAKAIEEDLADARLIQLGRDPALARKVGEFTLRRYGELKPALPRDPYQRE